MSLLSHSSVFPHLFLFYHGWCSCLRSPTRDTGEGKIEDIFLQDRAKVFHLSPCTFKSVLKPVTHLRERFRDFYFELGINYKDINSVLCSFFLQCPLQGSVHVHVSAILIAVFFTCPASVSLGKIPNPSWLHFICMSVRVCVSA